MVESDSEIIRLRQIRWKSPLSRKIEEFSELISDNEVFDRCFGEGYTNELATKSKAITHLVLKLGLIYSILMLSLYASQNINGSEFEIFGYGFKNLGNYKELLLLLAAVISPISAICSAYQKYLNALVSECLKKLSPDAKTRKYYSLKFVDEYFEWLPSRPTEKSISWHGFTIFLMVFLVVTLMLLFFTILVGSFFIQINVIYDIAINPSSSKSVNIFVLSVSISAILLSWLITIVQLPMPEVDVSNSLRLEEIREVDPVKYQTIMGRMADESIRREATSIFITSSMVYISIFTSLSIFFFPETLNNITVFLSKAMPGVFFVLFLSSETIKFVRKKILHWFFKKYPDESLYRLKVFGNVTKILVLIRVIFPLVFSLSYALYSLGSFLP
ncbi:hypothetical protein [Aeromonas salmonicida]|uniref:hypothetical protein n=1 Tax=Aeromonas salmonicida TaxID=645 RepID=UPI0030D2807B